MIKTLTILIALGSFCGLCFARDIPQYDKTAMKTDDARVVGMECHKKNKTLEIGYFTAYNIPNKLMDLWDTYDLKKRSADGETPDEFYEVKRYCNLGNERYIVLFRADGVSGWGYGGARGAITGARTRVYKNDVMVLDILFEENGKDEVITKVKFMSGDNKPEITKMSEERFIFGEE